MSLKSFAQDGPMSESKENWKKVHKLNPSEHKLTNGSKDSYVWTDNLVIRDYQKKKPRVKIRDCMYKPGFRSSKEIEKMISSNGAFINQPEEHFYLKKCDMGTGLFAKTEINKGLFILNQVLKLCNYIIAPIGRLI